MAHPPPQQPRLLTTPNKGKETSVTNRHRNNGKRIASRTPNPTEPHSAARRAFIVLAGTSAGATLLGGLSACGGSVSEPAAPEPASPPVVQDPIWGSSGAATQIIASLKGITQSMFPARDYVVTQYGAQPCSVVA